MDCGDLLFKSSTAMGIQLSNTQLEQFLQYKNLLLEWNKVMNLTAITDPADIALRHFADSISIGSPASGIDFNNKSIIDVGTGAGFPGIPLKIIFPSAQITLLDSLQKRVGFLDTVIKTLGLTGIEAIHSRAEDAGQIDKYREQFDFAVSRAVAPMAVLAEYCLPFVKVGGYFISLKGPAVDEELLQAKSAIKVLGGELASVRGLEIPLTDLHHSMVIIEKILQTPPVYPRKAGKAVKNPIK